MKKRNLLLMVGLLTIGFISCQKKENPKTVDTNTEISASAKAKINKLGFSAAGAQKVPGGYLVEGDILLTEKILDENPVTSLLNIAKTEHYRTTNVVKSMPRVFTISVSNLPAIYSDATNLMIERYNQLGLRISFQRANTGTIGDINVVGFNQGPNGNQIVLGSSGFPTAAGQPYNEIKMNTNEAAYGINPELSNLTSVLQHEVGHTIGLRHTDLANRAYSCGGQAVNEGASLEGAVFIPGTPSGADAGSFMLACLNGGNRTFNNNDIVALNYLYGTTTPRIFGYGSGYRGQEYSFTVYGSVLGDTFAWTVSSNAATITSGQNTQTLNVILKNIGGTALYTYPVSVLITSLDGTTRTATFIAPSKYCGGNCPL